MLIHTRYSTLIVNVLISMAFGVGLPLLFPIVFINLCIQYILDRLLTVYLYRQPPMFDAELTETALNIIQWAVVLYLGVGYWMMSNKQIFSNLVIPKEYSKEVLKTGHDVANIQFD